jgi:hypothetical protein
MIIYIFAKIIYKFIAVGQSHIGEFDSLVQITCYC